MSNTKLQWAPVGLERFGHLEDKIFRIVEEIKTIRKENQSLSDENSTLKGTIGEIETLRAENGRLQEQIRNQTRDNEALRGENNSLKEKVNEIEPLQNEIGSLKTQVETMRQSETETLDMLAQFEKEREEMRDRVEKTLSLLSSLDAQ